MPYEVYNQDRPKYTFPTYKVEGQVQEVGSATVYQIPVSEPAGEIAVEVFVPTQDAISRGGLSRNNRLPALVNFHGGGFVIGHLKTDDCMCRKICQKTGCIIVNVDYRLSPEFPHPTPVMDSYDALKWAVQNSQRLGIDETRLAVSGYSAGGCIAAVLALLARDDPSMPRLALQVPIVPVLDARYVPEEGSCDPEKVPYESYVSCEFAPMLPLARLVWFYNLWIGKGSERVAHANDFRASPIVAESFKNLAPASIHVAEIDPLKSEAEAYHEKLIAAGTPSKIKIYKGVGHTFGHWGGELPAGAEFVEDISTALKEAFTV